MNPTPVRDIAGKEAADRIREARQNVDNGATPAQARAIVRQRRPAPTTIQAADLTTPPPPLTTPPAPAVGSIPTRTNSLVQNVARDVNGLITADTENRRRRDELAMEMGALGEQGSLADLFTQQRQDLGIDENMRELRDIQLQLADMDTASALTKTRIEGAAGQSLSQGQREVTQEDRENAVRTAGMAARAAVLQGNINTATQLAKDAVNIAYQDRQLNAQNILNQLNYYQSIVSEEEAQLLEQDKRAYEAELSRIEEVKDAVSTAIVTGGATQAEISQLTDPALDDASKLALAQQITARGANEMRNLEIQQMSASIRASNASAALNEAELVAQQKAEEAAAAGILTSEQAKTANDLNKDFESQPIVKAYNEGLQQYIALEDTLANGINGIQDMQLVYAFMKSVDPQSVVRETEFENAAKTGNIFQGAYARFNGALKAGGFLPEEVKQDFIRAARASFDAKNTQYFNVKSEYAKRINNTLGISNGANYLTAYEAAAPLTQADFGIAEALSNATPEEAQEILLMSQQMTSTPQR